MIPAAKENLIVLSNFHIDTIAFAVRKILMHEDAFIAKRRVKDTFFVKPDQSDAILEGRTVGNPIMTSGNQLTVVLLADSDKEIVALTQIEPQDAIFGKRIIKRSVRIQAINGTVVIAP